MIQEVPIRVFSPDKFRAVMAFKNVSNVTLAKFMGMTKQTVSTYAQGHATPDVNTFLRMAAYLGQGRTELECMESLTDTHMEEVDDGTPEPDTKETMEVAGE